MAEEQYKRFQLRKIPMKLWAAFVAVCETQGLTRQAALIKLIHKAVKHGKV